MAETRESIYGVPVSLFLPYQQLLKLHCLFGPRPLRIFKSFCSNSRRMSSAHVYSSLAIALSFVLSWPLIERLVLLLGLPCCKLLSKHC
jgi:hypothetical protein